MCVCLSVSQARLIQSASHNVNIAAPADSTDVILTPVVLDRGSLDGIRRILFGAGFEFWLHRVLFLDAMSFLSHGQLSQPLDRFILVDVDDIFVARSGVRLTQEDVTVPVCLPVCPVLIIIVTLWTCCSAL